MHGALPRPEESLDVGDNVALTQTGGWVDAWTSTPSPYAVAARNAADVAVGAGAAWLKS